MHLSSDEEFTCSLTTVIDAKTSVLKSTVANPSPFDSVINCLLPLNVEVGFVALGVTGGQYEGLVQVMFIDPPRATSASPRPGRALREERGTGRRCQTRGCFKTSVHADASSRAQGGS